VLVAVELTSLARNRLPQRLWRIIHVASLPLFLLSTIHYVAAGTDASNRLSLAAIGVVTATIALLFTRRMHEVRARGGGLIPATTRTRVAAPTGTFDLAEPSPADRVAALAARRASSSAR
jgi:hypothetical protein